MQLLNTITEFLVKVLQWWFTVMPWEQALLIRKGKNVKLLNAGLYLKIPFIDQVYIQTTRMRMVDIPMQTFSTKDGVSITIKSAIGYTIDDIQKLYKTLYHPDMTLSSMTMGALGEFIMDSDIQQVTTTAIESFVKGKITSDLYGLAGFEIKITTFAKVKTFRLIQDNSYLYEGLSLEPKK